MICTDNLRRHRKIFSLFHELAQCVASDYLFGSSKTHSLDIFDVGAPETFDRTQVLRIVWIDSDLDENLTRQEETRAFEEYRKSGGRYPALGRMPSTPPSFPRRTRKSEGGCVDCGSGCDDSLRRRARGPKTATLLTEPQTASTDSDMPDLE